MRAKPALLTFFLPCTAGNGSPLAPRPSFLKLLSPSFARLRPHSAAPYLPPSQSDLITPAIVCTHTPITHRQRLLIPIPIRLRPRPLPPRNCIRDDQTNMRRSKAKLEAGLSRT